MPLYEGFGHYDERIKFQLYAEEGLPFYFLVYPEREVVKAYRLQEGEYRKSTTSARAPGRNRFKTAL